MLRAEALVWLEPSALHRRFLALVAYELVGLGGPAGGAVLIARQCWATLMAWGSLRAGEMVLPKKQGSSLNHLP